MIGIKTFGIATFLSGANGGKQVRAIVAASSQRKAADALQVTLGELRKYAAETGNKIEIEVATAKPGTVYWQSVNTCGNQRDEWLQWERQTCEESR